MNDAEQEQTRPEFIGELYKNSQALIVQRYTGSNDCITYITTEEAIKICKKYISRPIEQQVSREVGGQPTDKYDELAKEIATLINQRSLENDSNTPDFILAEYLVQCLKTFNWTNNKREKWYGKSLSIV